MCKAIHHFELSSHMNDVQTQQNAVIKELSAIEDELDSLLPQYENYEVYYAQQSHQDEVPIRDQVFKMATQLDAEVDGLNTKLNEVQQQVDEHTLKNKRDARQQALLIGSYAG